MAGAHEHELEIAAQTLASGPGVALALDLDGAVVGMTQAAKTLLCLPAGGEERDALESLPVDSRAALRRSVADVLAGAADATVDRVEPNVVDGATVYPLRGLDGSTVGAGVVLTPAVAPASLSEAERRYRQLAEQLPLVPYISKPAGPGTGLEYIGPQVVELLGYEPEDFYADLDLWRDTLLHPDDRDRVIPLIETVAERGTVGEMEYRLIARDGRVVWVSDVTAPLPPDLCADGPLLQGFMLDISRRKQAERERADAEARYRVLAERLPLVMYVDGLDPTTPSLYVSGALENLLGYTVEEWLAAPTIWFDLLHPDDHGRAAAAVNDGYRRQEPHIELEYRIRRQDGSYAWVHDEAVLVHDNAGTPLYYQGFIIDLTERKELEERYVQAQRLQSVGRLAGGVAHDFNNILTAIRGYATFLAERLEAETELRSDATEIVRAAERAERLTRQLLAFGGRQVLQPRPISLNATVAGIKRLLTRAAGDRVALVVELSDDEPWTLADPEQIEQVLLNLVVNARDATPAGGTVRITTGRVRVEEGQAGTVPPGDYAMLSVTDTGIGMSDDVAASIFEPFFTTKEEGVGSGLGLATVFGIVTQSGGHVDVESTEGAGTALRVLLPEARGVPDELERPAPAAVTESLPRTGQTILLVEDEPQVRTLTSRMLESSGYRVVSAENGAAALDHPELATVHVVVSDLVMPELGGRELAERLRVVRPGLQVLLVSGYAADELGQGWQLPEGAAFLAKPFAQDALVDAVAGLLGDVASDVDDPARDSAAAE